MKRLTGLLVDSIKELKDSATRVLVLVCIITSVWLYLDNRSTLKQQAKGYEERLNRCDANGKTLAIRIDSFVNDAIQRTETENIRLKRRIAWQDSIKDVLRGIISRRK